MTDENHSRAPGILGSADPDWRDGALRSRAFGDVYFSVADGLGETRYVFLDGIGGAGGWAGRLRFHLGELGFGTGLNFLALWDSWRRTAPADARLHVVSVEGFPLGVDDLAKAHAAFPELADLASALRGAWPRRVPGLHRLRLDGGRVCLTLLFGPVLPMLRQMAGRMDAWFLDGFAPKHNPDMWTDDVFAEVARLSAPGARLATFSAAGAVRRGLTAQGFAMEKRPGFGDKSESLIGRYKGAAANRDFDPWYAPPPPLAPGAQVAVIGGGIAGRAAVRAAADEGFRVTLLDPAGPTAQPDRVLVSPRLADPAEPYGRFMAQAFVHADARADLPPAAGALHLPDGEAGRLLDFAGRLGWGNDLAQAVTAAEASDLAGLPVTRGGVWFPAARFAAPPGLAAAEVRQARVTALAPDDSGWAITLADGSSLAADAVIAAAGPWSASLLPGSGMDLRANRGQLSYLPATARSARLRLPVSFGGHLTPVTGLGGGEAGHVLGSSYGRWDLTAAPDGWEHLTERDRAAPMAKLAEVVPGLAEAWGAAPLTGWAGLRATTADHLPLVGPVADAAGYEAAYADLHHGRRGDWPVAPYQMGAYVLSGLGSRGYQTAFLAAEILASQMSGAPLPIDREVAAALHPGRMVVRRLRRPPARQEGDE